MPDDIVERLRVRQLLEVADVVYGADAEDADGGRGAQTLNMNDVWGWALAWGEYVPDAELPRVAELFTRYGSAGLYYWVSERHENMRSEFHDVNRAIEFVRHEEELRKRMPSSSERAYARMSYTLGGDMTPLERIPPLSDEWLRRLAADKQRRDHCQCGHSRQAHDSGCAFCWFCACGEWVACAPRLRPSEGVKA